MRLVVITPPELEHAYRLAGTATMACSSAAEVEATLRDLGEQRFKGVVAVHQPFVEALPRGLVDELARLDSLLLVGLPDGERSKEAEDHRGRLRRLLREALGYDVMFESKGETR